MSAADYFLLSINGRPWRRCSSLKEAHEVIPAHFHIPDYFNAWPRPPKIRDGLYISIEKATADKGLELHSLFFEDYTAQVANNQAPLEGMRLVTLENSHGVIMERGTFREALNRLPDNYLPFIPKATEQDLELGANEVYQITTYVLPGTFGREINLGNYLFYPVKGL